MGNPRPPWNDPTRAVEVTHHKHFKCLFLLSFFPGSVQRETKTALKGPNFTFLPLKNFFEKIIMIVISTAPATKSSNRLTRNHMKGRREEGVAEQESQTKSFRKCMYSIIDAQTHLPYAHSPLWHSKESCARRVVTWVFPFSFFLSLFLFFFFLSSNL